MPKSALDVLNEVEAQAKQQNANQTNQKSALDILNTIDTNKKANTYTKPKDPTILDQVYGFAKGTGMGLADSAIGVAQLANMVVGTKGSQKWLDDKANQLNDYHMDNAMDGTAGSTTAGRFLGGALGAIVNPARLAISGGAKVGTQLAPKSIQLAEKLAKASNAINNAERANIVGRVGVGAGKGALTAYGTTPIYNADSTDQSIRGQNAIAGAGFGGGAGIVRSIFGNRGGAGFKESAGAREILDKTGLTKKQLEEGIKAYNERQSTRIDDYTPNLYETNPTTGVQTLGKDAKLNTPNGNMANAKKARNEALVNALKKYKLSETEKASLKKKRSDDYANAQFPDVYIDKNSQLAKYLDVPEVQQLQKRHINQLQAEGVDGVAKDQRVVVDNDGNAIPRDGLVLNNRLVRALANEWEDMKSAKLDVFGRDQASKADRAYATPYANSLENTLKDYPEYQAVNNQYSQNSIPLNTSQLAESLIDSSGRTISNVDGTGLNPDLKISGFQSALDKWRNNNDVAKNIDPNLASTIDSIQNKLEYQDAFNNTAGKANLEPEPRGIGNFFGIRQVREALQQLTKERDLANIDTVGQLYNNPELLNQVLGSTRYNIYNNILPSVDLIAPAVNWMNQNGALQEAIDRRKREKGE